MDDNSQAGISVAMPVSHSVVSSSGGQADSLRARAADLGSVEVMPITKRLTGIFLSTITDERIRADLSDLTNKLILGDAPPVNTEIYKAGLAVAKRYSGSVENQAQIAGYFAKIGYLLDIAGHISDTNVINEFRGRTDKAIANFNPDDPNAKVPELREDQVLRRSFADMLFRTNRDKTIDEVIANFKKLTQEDIFTMHPTGMLTVASAQTLRQIHDNSINFARAPSEARWRDLTKVIRHFASPDFSLTPVKESGPAKGQKTSLTVSGEVDYETQYMRNNIEAEERVYKELDDNLRKRYGNQYNVARQIDVQLNRKDGGWTGSDVDGNKNKTAGFMLEKIIKRRLEDASVYGEYLRRMEKEALSLSPESSKAVEDIVNKWSIVYSDAQAKLRVQLARIQDAKDPEGNIHLSTKVYDDISKATANAFAAHGTFKQLTKELTEQTRGLLQPYIDRNVEPPSSMLFMHRRLRDSGLTLAHTEMRENASVHQKVIEYVLADFDHPLLGGKKFHELVDAKGNTDHKKRAEFLNALIKENHGTMGLLVKNALGRIERNPEVLKNQDSIEFVTHHTLKRLENAHRHEGTVENMLIAECKGVGDIMSAFALQRMISAYVNDDKKLQLHVCPLFEDPAMLKQMAQISKDALKYSEYREHVRSLGNIVKIMRAYSDNWRLTGTIASITGLMGSHYQTLKRHLVGGGTVEPDVETFTVRDRRSGAKEQVRIEYHEGMGECDMHRGGGRDRGARMWQYGSQEHSKGTLQGIADFLNMANILSRLSRIVESGFVYAGMLNFNKHSIQSSPSEDFVIAAGKDTIKAFQKRHLSDEAQEFFATAIINAKIVGDTRNASSRAVKRGNDVVANDDFIQQGPVDLGNSRAITTSKFWSEANIVQTWAVADAWTKSMNLHWQANNLGIQDYLVNRANELMASRALPARKVNITAADLFNKKEGLTALAFQTLYNDHNAPTFRYVMDVVSAGVRRSPLELLDFRKQMEEQEGLNGKHNKYLENMRREFMAAAKLTVQIFAPKSLPKDEAKFVPNTENCQELRQIIIRDALPDLELAEKGRYANLVHALRDGSIFAYDAMRKAGNHIATKDLWQRTWRELGAANDSAYYGRHGSADAGVRTARRIIREEQQKLVA